MPVIFVDASTSERQVISCGERHFASGCRRGSSGSSSGSTTLGRSGRLHHSIRTGDVICTNFIEPSAIVFVGVNIERHRNILPILDIERLDSVLSEQSEQTLSGILSGHFYHILLRHPGIACALRHSTISR